MEHTWTLADEAATLDLGRALGRSLKALPGPATVFLEGDLGAGKTTTTRGVLQAFGHTGAVKSPTYTLVEAYEWPERAVYHFDLYRLGDPEELEYMGIRDYFAGDSVCILEWPERGQGYLPTPDLCLHLQVAGKGREARLGAATKKGQQILAQVSESY